MTARGRLLYIINHMDWFWSHRLPLALAAKDAGWDVIVAAHGAEQDARLKDYGFRAAELPSSPLSLFFALRRLQQTFKPDVTHAITLKYVFLSGLACRTISHKRLVHTIAGLGYLFSNDALKAKIMRLFVAPFLKLALRDSRVIFQNRDDQALMVEGGFVRPEQVFLIPGSGVDIEQFPFREEPEQNPPVVLMPTRLVHDKGISIFIEAARLLKKRGVNARFQIAGGLDAHNPRAITEKEMRRMVADGSVEWLGKINDMPALLAKTNLITYPSWYREGVPKVLLEAASSGRAIVTTDHPGCREAVAHNVNGLLMPIKDAAATADAIETLLRDSARRKNMGAAGRKRAEEEFNVKNIAAETIKLY